MPLMSITPDNYLVLQRLNEDLVRVYVHDLLGNREEVQMWSKARMRKERACCVCTETIQKGEQAYRPLGFPWNRYVRAHAHCIDCQKEEKQHASRVQ